MKKVVLTVLSLCLLCQLALSQASLKGEKEIQVGQFAELEVVDVPKGAGVDWDYSDKLAVRKLAGNKILFTGRKGKYPIRILVISVVDGQVNIDKLKWTLTIKDDEAPDPGPSPGPGPSPVPSLAPIDGDGFRVLLVEETSKRKALTDGQFNALFSVEMLDFLDANCVKDKDNPNGAYRIWDKDQRVKNDSASWIKAMARPRSSVPWIIVSNGKTGYEGPLPEKLEDTYALLKKYGAK